MGKAVAEENAFLKAAQRNGGKFDPDDFQRMREISGVSLFEADLDLKPDTVYRAVQYRWLPGLLFRRCMIDFPRINRTSWLDDGRLRGLGLIASRVGTDNGQDAQCRAERGPSRQNVLRGADGKTAPGAENGRAWQLRKSSGRRRRQVVSPGQKLHGDSRKARPRWRHGSAGAQEKRLTAEEKTDIRAVILLT